MAIVRRTQRQGQQPYDADRRETTAELELLHRKKDATPRPVPLVKVTPEADESWPPGTAWLDTSVEV